MDFSEFEFSQNALNTFRSCPKKFGYKYVQGLNWKKEGDEEYYKSLKYGTEFHLMCERYFSGIPVGKFTGNKEYEKFDQWLEKVKKAVPIYEDREYLPEYGLSIKIDEESRLTAKYDLAVIYRENGQLSIDIWDWKTENRKLKYNDLEKRMQSIVYMAVAYEAIPKIYGNGKEKARVRMYYYQPEYYAEPIELTYSEEKFENDKIKIEGIIKEIKKSDFEYKNLRSCKYCEFNMLCNRNSVDESVYEDYEEIYE